MVVSVIGRPTLGGVVSGHLISGNHGSYSRALGSKVGITDMRRALPSPPQACLVSLLVYFQSSVYRGSYEEPRSLGYLFMCHSGLLHILIPHSEPIRGISHGPFAA